MPNPNHQQQPRPLGNTNEGGSDVATELLAAQMPDPDAVAALWLAEDQQADHLAEVRAQLDVEAKADWLDEARAKERTRKRLEAIRRTRTHLPPPPVAPRTAEPAQAQRLDVHHTFDPQPAPRSTGGGLYLAARVLAFLTPIAVIVGAFIILIVSALLIGEPATPAQRARTGVADQEWTCDDAATVEALTVTNDVLWHWITPIGPCDELNR